MSFSWATLQCEDNGTPNELKKVLGKARCLIRFSEMDPSATADGPSCVSQRDAEFPKVYHQVYIHTILASFSGWDFVSG